MNEELGWIGGWLEVGVFMHPPHSFTSKKNEAEKKMLQYPNTTPNFAFLAVHHHMNTKLNPHTLTKQRRGHFLLFRIQQ